MNAIKYKNNREYKTGDETGDEIKDNAIMKFEVYEIENNKENSGENSGENIRNNKADNNRNDIKDNRGNNEEDNKKDNKKEDSSLKFEVHECVRGGM